MLGLKLFTKNNNKYLVTVEFNKYGWNKKPIIRSQAHKGNKVNNNFIQFIMEINNPDTFLDDVEKIIIEEYPKATNIKVVGLKKF